MNRTLVAAAAVVFLLVGLGPLVAMALRVGPADLGAALVAERTLPLLLRTAGVGLGAAFVALALGLPYGWLTARTDLPGAPLFRALGILPLVLPPLLLAVSWAGMTALRGGLATTLVLGFATFPLVALYSARAFERVDARLEESALLAGGLGTVLRAELPLALPSALVGACFAFVFAVNDFAVPDYVSSIGTKFNVYADEVFATWRSSQQTGRAVAAALPLILLTLLALLPALELRRRNLLAGFRGDFRRPEPLRLGAWKLPALAFALAVLTTAALAPLARLVWEAGGGPRGFALATMRDAFARALELGRVNLQTSLLASAAAALIGMALGLVLGHALERGAPRARWPIVALVLPICVPAILFGIGSIALWNRPMTGTLYDSTWMVVALSVGRFLPFAALAFAAAVAMLDPRLEEAARLAGIGPFARLTRVVAPALFPALAGGATLVFVLSMRELDAAVLVPAGNGTVLFRLYNAVHFGRDEYVAALALLVTFFVALPGLAWALFARRRLELLP